MALVLWFIYLCLPVTATSELDFLVPFGLTRALLSLNITITKRKILNLIVDAFIFQNLRVYR